MQARDLLNVSLVLVISLTVGPVAAEPRAGGNTNWPQFRGHGARGIAEGYTTPVTWNGQSGSRVKWRTPIPGLGHSSPIIWGDRLFVTSAISGKKAAGLKVGLYGDIASVNDDTPHEFRVYCLDKKTGKILWDKMARRSVPKVKRHPKATHANSTPVTDGRHIVAFFGSEGLYCYDFDGKLLWKKDLGTLDAAYYIVPGAQWEYGASPIIYKNMVIVQCDVLSNSFLAAFDVTSGKELWRTTRKDVPTWSTPTVYEGPPRAELIVNGFHHIGGYDPMTGQELWKMDGGADIPVPTPIVADGLIYITSAHGRQPPLYAIRVGAQGDITLPPGEKSSEHVAWSYPNHGIYMQTPMVYRDYLYMCRNNGVMACYAASSGEILYRKRVGDGETGFTASAVAADEKLYFSGEDGNMYVLQAGPEPEFLSTNPMGEALMATPAISAGKLYIRGQKHLFCIGE